ncbi:aminodeoxychorismate lyase [Corynebacterium renale]|uniref:4-amino-4-deoxychorismate lyase n=1 Tax=Corynebacterium renale TaxID=1724 RepID=A0A2A9DMY9_9CORY|nr:aminodeoxychorismate lyase [Corynebacterium renale]PFG28068.1 4-amino-4-deoxychorismate lyase [Corynebacterium renale]SQI20895.1 4-amino-4-deoxychorismate lyase [Corynebacterium renale]
MASFGSRTPDPVIIIVEPFGGSTRQHNPNLPFIFGDDAAVTRGDGIFETLLVAGGHVANFDRHFARFTSSAKRLGLPAPQLESWKKASAEAVEAWQATFPGMSPGDVPPAKCVWTYSRGRAATGLPTAWITINPIAPEVLEQRESGIAVMTGPRGIDPQADASVPWAMSSAKTLNYATNMAALRYAKSQGFDDFIFTDSNPDNPRVLEGATSTVVIAKKNGRLRTPSTGADVLKGTTQAALFEAAQEAGWKVKEKTIYLSDLYNAESVWLVSSVRMGARVTRLNDTVLPEPDNAAEIQELITKALQA